MAPSLLPSKHAQKSHGQPIKFATNHKITIIYTTIHQSTNLQSISNMILRFLKLHDQVHWSLQIEELNWRLSCCMARQSTKQQSLAPQTIKTKKNYQLTCTIAQICNQTYNPLKILDQICPFGSVNLILKLSRTKKFNFKDHFEIKLISLPKFLIHTIWRTKLVIPSLHPSNTKNKNSLAQAIKFTTNHKITIIYNTNYQN